MFETSNIVSAISKKQSNMTTSWACHIYPKYSDTLTTIFYYQFMCLQTACLETSWSETTFVLYSNFHFVGHGFEVSTRKFIHFVIQFLPLSERIRNNPKYWADTSEQTVITQNATFDQVLHCLRLIKHHYRYTSTGNKIDFVFQTLGQVLQGGEVAQYYGVLQIYLSHHACQTTEFTWNVWITLLLTIQVLK